MKRNFVFTDDHYRLSVGAYKFDPSGLFAIYERLSTHEIDVESLSWISDFSELRDYTSRMLLHLRSARMRRKYASFRVVLKLYDGYFVTLFYL